MGMVLDVNVGGRQMSGELQGRWCKSRCNPLPLSLIYQSTSHYIIRALQPPATH